MPPDPACPPSAAGESAPLGDPVPLSDFIRAKMVAQPSKDTKPELLLRRALHAAGHRYRINVKVPGAPRRTIDIAFTRAKLAVMVDGCFWHGCPVHCVPPKHNAEWWAQKLHKNQTRDAETTELLESGGWTVLRIWEHVPADEARALVQSTLMRLREAPAHA